LQVEVDGNFGKQPSGKTKGLYDSAIMIQKLLEELGLSLLDASSNLRSEWHHDNISRQAPHCHGGTPIILYPQAFFPDLPPAFCSHQRGFIIHITRAQLAPR
jgi:hypothetical protein